NEKMYQEWHKSQLKDAWKRFNETIELFKKLKGKTRTVVRMTLVKDLNMEKEHVEQYAEIIKKANPDFVEIKGFMSVGFARQRIGYEKMPWHKDVKRFSKKLLKFLPKYKFLDDKKESCVVLLGKSKAKMKIKEKEI
ncbi:MAG: 4-demethylwyosine synthase TYW1, partial [Nanoarchaeota archaeon]|nr:4-demethylwyosine synthase TYW1 [Nanoarchaeota archaeon]